MRPGFDSCQLREGGRTLPFLFFRKGCDWMTLDRERIKAAFSAYSGESFDEASERGRLCAALCEECACRAEQMLKHRPEQSEDALPSVESWAAAEAFYQLALVDEALTPEKFSADGVEISGKNGAQRARALADEKFRAALPVLGEGAFYFGGI